MKHRSVGVRFILARKDEVYPRPKGCGLSLPSKSGIKPDTTLIDILNEQALSTSFIYTLQISYLAAYIIEIGK